MWENYLPNPTSSTSRKLAWKIYQRIHRIGPYERSRSPTPFDLNREFGIDLTTARKMIGLEWQSSGPGGRGEAWFVHEASKILDHEMK